MTTTHALFLLALLLTQPSFADGPRGSHVGGTPAAKAGHYQLAQAPAKDDAAKAEADEDDPTWVKYNEDTKNEPPEAILVETMNKIPVDKKNPPYFIDVGAGGGRDTMALLKHGWRGMAVDMTAASTKELKKRADKAYPGKLETQVEWMEDMKLKKSSADLVNASYSLPFVQKEVLKKDVMPKILDAMKPGSLFSGQFFAMDHPFNKEPNMNFFEEAELRKFLREAGFEIVTLEKVKFGTKWGEDKTVFDVVAKKPIPDAK